MRNEDHFNLWWENLVKRGDDVGIDQPTLAMSLDPFLVHVKQFGLTTQSLFAFTLLTGELL